MKSKAAYTGSGRTAQARRTADDSLWLRVAKLLLAGAAHVLQMSASAVLRQPAAAAGAIIGGGVVLTIIVNAVALQSGQHPSPLFATGDQIPRTVTVKPATAPAMPPPRPHEESTISGAVAQPQTAPQNPPAPAKPVQSASLQPAAPANDPIAQLLATGAPPVQRSVGPMLGIQNALVALGYPITADGMMGPATRKAIEDFERDKGLPVTGDPATPATRKALSSSSGMAID